MTDSASPLRRVANAMIGATLALGFAALPAFAACDGPNFIDRLTPEDRASLEAATAATPYAEGLLWTAARDGQIMTLIGTMHIYDPRHDAIMQRITETVSEADLVLLEMTDAEEEDLSRAMSDEPDKMFITEGPSLLETLDAETWTAVAEAARLRDMPPFMAAKFQPWYLMLMLSLPPCAMADLMDGRLGLDHMIMDFAAQEAVALQALEPWDTLLGIFADKTEAEQIDMLRMSLVTPDIQEEVMVATIEGYFAGRIAEIWELSRLSLDYMPDIDPTAAEDMFALFEDVLLTERNLNWIPVIETAAASHETVVIAAGAAHFPGENGILRLLEAEGWEIAPLY